VMIALSLQLLTDLLGNSAGLATADGQFGQVVEGLGRLLKGALPQNLWKSERPLR
jgi:hypothetical protein